MSKPTLLLLTFTFCIAVVSAQDDDQESNVAPDPATIDSVALHTFLKRFDPIAKRGFVKTLRPGSTGIGYTLETLLKIEENNSPGGDFLGMEIKAYRDSETRFDDHEKMNLFLKEPQWLDRKTSVERIRAYVYVDDNGRDASYQSVTSKVNAQRLRLQVDRERELVRMLRQQTRSGSGRLAATS